MCGGERGAGEHTHATSASINRGTYPPVSDQTAMRMEPSSSSSTRQWHRMYMSRGATGKMPCVY